jgi:hypothetical protein
MKPKLKSPGTDRLKPKGEILLSIYASKFNQRRYSSEIDELEFKHYDFTNAGSISVQDFGYSVVGRCRLTS